MSEQTSGKKITMGLIMSWIFGVIFALTGIASVFSDPIPGIVMLIIAAVLLPPFTKLANQKWNFNLSKGVKIIVIIIGLIIFGATIDTPDVTTYKQAETQKEEQKIANGETMTEQVNEEMTQAETNEQINTEKTEAIPTSAEKKLDYKIIYEINKQRYDGGKNFYVLIDKIDLSTADFKNDIKKMVDEIVKSKGEKISIDFVNNKETLDLIYKSHYGNNTLGRILTKSEMDKIGESLIAQFSGQLETNIYFNTLSFFSGTYKSNPKVGKYVETIEYNPNK